MYFNNNLDNGRSIISDSRIQHILEEEERKNANYVERLFESVKSNPYTYYTESEVFSMTQDKIIRELQEEKKLRELKEANKSFSKNEYKIGK